jgi:hypothetical protein
MSQGADILTALKSRLQSITVANSYGRTIKNVRLSRSGMDLDIPPQDCPIIEIYQESADVESGASAHIIVTYTILLLLIDRKDQTDEGMEDFQADVKAAIYGAGPAASGNTGITLGGKAVKCQWVGSDYDLNLIQANRRTVMTWQITSSQSTYKR